MSKYVRLCVICSYILKTSTLTLPRSSLVPIDEVSVEIIVAWSSHYCIIFTHSMSKPSVSTYPYHQARWFQCKHL